MKKEKAFTLIELLAVIVILAIIAVIATPIAINVINDARKRSFINSVYGLIDGARLLSAEQLFDAGTNEVVVQFQDGTADNTNLKVSGDMPASGTLHLNSEGKVELKVWSEELGKCAEKSTTEAEVKLIETTKENCKIKICSKIILGKKITSNEIACADPDLNTRYVGLSPNNYVYFNKDENGNPEKWRIIGVFDGKTKIIKNDYYSESIQWDNNGTNDWTISTLQSELNTNYLNKIQTNDPTSYGYIDLEHKWELGAITSDESSWTRSNIYNCEREKTNSEGVTWEGTIGIMYPSDYGYASNGNSEMCETESMATWNEHPECYNNSWLYNSVYKEWTMTPHKEYAPNVFAIWPSSSISHTSVDRARATRITLYLKPNVKIIDGKGTEQEPYILGT